MEFRWGWLADTITEKNLYCGSLSSNTISSEMNDNLDGTYTFTTEVPARLTYNQIYIHNMYDFDNTADLICDIISQVEANGVTILTVKPNYHISFLRMWCRQNLDSKDYHYCRLGDLADDGYKLIDDKELEDLTNSLRVNTRVTAINTSTSYQRHYYTSYNSNSRYEVDSSKILPAIYALFVADNNGVIMIPIIDAKNRTSRFGVVNNANRVCFSWPNDIETTKSYGTLHYYANSFNNNQTLSNDYFTVGCLAGVLGDSVLGMFPIPNFWTMVGGSWSTWTDAAVLYETRGEENNGRSYGSYILGFQIEKLPNVTFTTYIESSLSSSTISKDQTTLSVSAGRYLTWKTNMIEYNPYKWWMITGNYLPSGTSNRRLVGMNLDWEGLKIWLAESYNSPWPIKDRALVSNIKLSFPSSKFSQWYAQNAANIENAKNSATMNLAIGIVGGVLSSIAGMAMVAFSGGVAAPLAGLIELSGLGTTLGGLAKVGSSTAKGTMERVAINKTIDNNKRIMASNANIYNSNYLTRYLVDYSTQPTTNFFEYPKLSDRQIKTLNNFLYYNGEVCDYYGSLGLRTRAIRMAPDSAAQFRQDLSKWLNGVISTPVNAVIKGYNSSEIVDSICNSFLDGIFIVV